MSKTTITDKIVTVADLIAALQKIEDKDSFLTVAGEAGGDHWHSPEEFDRTIESIEIDTWDSFPGMVALKI